MYRSLWPLLLMLASTSNAFSQHHFSDALTEDFILSVQTIDDFFERFNNSPAAPSIKYIKAKYPKAKADRSIAILSLFDRSDTNWTKSDLKAFTNRFSSDTAVRLDFDQSNWYAVVHSKVVHKNKKVNLDIIMVVEPVVNINSKSKSIGYKWSLFSAQARFFPKADSLKPTLDSVKVKPVIGSDGQFLHPMSHAINFMNIHDVFRKGVVRKYFARKARSPELNSLARMVDQGSLRFLQVDSISYSLLQLPGWILEVDYFEREGGNSGWLISRLKRADAEYKRRYLSQYLNIR